MKDCMQSLQFGTMKQAAIWPVSFCFSWETSWATEDRIYSPDGKKKGGGDIQEDKNSKRLPQEPCFPQWSRAIWKGQFKINGFHRWGFGAPAHAAFQQLEIRKVKLQISYINWRRIQTKLQAISTAEEWFSPEYNNWITGSPFFIQVCG